MTIICVVQELFLHTYIWLSEFQICIQSNEIHNVVALIEFLLALNQCNYIVYLVGMYIYIAKMIHGPYNVKLNFKLRL